MKTKDKILLISFIILIVGFLFYQLRLVLPVFLTSLIIAYFLDPLVDFLVKIKISRLVASLLIIFSFFAILAFLLILILPTIYHQFIQILSNLPQILDDFYVQYSDFLQKFGIHTNGQLEEFIEQQKAKIISPDFVKESILNLLGSSVAVINFLSIIFIMPILIFYFLKDWNLLVSAFKKNLPKKSAAAIENIMQDIDKSLSGYVRGQALVCLVMAIFYAVSLTLINLDFGFLIGFLTGIFTFVPYVGALSGFVFAFCIALFQGGFSFGAIIPILLVFGVGQFLESNFITPKFVGSRIGLHPVWMIFGLFVFGVLFGIFGVFFAVPLTAIAGVLIKYIVKEYHKKFV